MIEKWDEIQGKLGLEIEQRLPTIWKMADVTPLPKKKPVVDIQK